MEQIFYLDIRFVQKITKIISYNLLQVIYITYILYFTYNIVNNITDGINKLLRMQAVFNITLREMNQRLTKVENATKRPSQTRIENDQNIIIPFLPLTTVERIKEFDSLLKTSNESVEHFVSIYFNFLLYYVLTQTAKLLTYVQKRDIRR